MLNRCSSAYKIFEKKKRFSSDYKPKAIYCIHVFVVIKFEYELVGFNFLVFFLWNINTIDVASR